MLLVLRNEASFDDLEMLNLRDTSLHESSFELFERETSEFRNPSANRYCVAVQGSQPMGPSKAVASEKHRTSISPISKKIFRVGITAPTPRRYSDPV